MSDSGIPLVDVGKMVLKQCEGIERVAKHLQREDQQQNHHDCVTWKSISDRDREDYFTKAIQIICVYLNVEDL